MMQAVEALAGIEHARVTWVSPRDWAAVAEHGALEPRVGEWRDVLVLEQEGWIPEEDLLACVGWLRREHPAAPLVIRCRWGGASSQVARLASRAAYYGCSTVLASGESLESLRVHLADPVGLVPRICRWLALVGWVSPEDAAWLESVFEGWRRAQTFERLLRGHARHNVSTCRHRISRLGLASSGQWLPMLRAVDVVLHLQLSRLPPSDEGLREAGFLGTDAFVRKSEAWFGAGPEELTHLAGWEPLLERWTREHQR